MIPLEQPENNAPLWSTWRQSTLPSWPFEATALVPDQRYNEPYDPPDTYLSFQETTLTIGSHFPGILHIIPFLFVQSLTCLNPTVINSLSFLQAPPVTLAPQTGELQAILLIYQS